MGAPVAALLEDEEPPEAGMALLDDDVPLELPLLFVAVADGVPAPAESDPGLWHTTQVASVRPWWSAGSLGSGRVVWHARQVVRPA